MIRGANLLSTLHIDFSSPRRGEDAEGQMRGD